MTNAVIDKPDDLNGEHGEDDDRPEGDVHEHHAAQKLPIEAAEVEERRIYDDDDEQRGPVSGRNAATQDVLGLHGNVFSEAALGNGVAVSNLGVDGGHLVAQLVS